MIAALEVCGISESDQAMIMGGTIAKLMKLEGY